jgi:hypothetical protein
MTNIGEMKIHIHYVKYIKLHIKYVFAEYGQCREFPTMT